MSRVRLLDLLGLQVSATRDEIRSRYHELARKFHPDVNADDERAHARFRAIVAAYQELLSDGPEERSSGEWAAVAVEASDVDVASQARPASRDQEGPLARRYAEARARLDQCRRMADRAQAEVRDGDTRALTARQRGDDGTARHFDRRAEADRSRLYALLGEILGLERELTGLEVALAGSSGEIRATRSSSEPGLDPGGRLNREVHKLHDEERAVLRKKYEDGGRRR
jgi:curved DNA-binding protein CbpA